MEEQITKAWDSIAEAAPGVIGALIGAIAVFIIGKWVSRWIASLVRKSVKKGQSDDMLAGFAGSLTYFGLLALVIIAALGTLGVETAQFAVVLGAAGLAVGFALQGTLSNFAAGVMLLVFRPFKAGDVVEAGGATGVVKELQLFTTTLTTPDNKLVIVPNSAMSSGNIVNYNALGTRRVDMVFGIGYEDDIPRAKEILEDILAKDDRVLKDPGSTVALVELADSSVNFVCRPWVNASDYWGVWFDTHETVKARFDDAGVSIPFPQQDVHMHQAA